MQLSWLRGLGRGSPPKSPEDWESQSSPPPAERGQPIPQVRVALITCRWLWRTTLSLLCLLGLCVLYDDLIGDGPIPAPRTLKSSDSNLLLQTRLNTTLRLYGNFRTTSDYWTEMQPTVQLLAAVAPEVADWLTEKHESGKLRLSNQAGFQATWDFLNGTLTLHRGLFAEPDGVKVSQIMHEYRHSRQSLAKFIRLSVSHVFFEKGRHEIVEQDAHTYEILALEAMGMNDRVDEPGLLFSAGLEAYGPNHQRPMPPAMATAARVTPQQ